VEDSDVVGKWTERQLEDVRRRYPVLDLHRSLVHHQHRARRNDEQNWNKLKLKKRFFNLSKNVSTIYDVCRKITKKQ
jgi:hypothetical protein